MISLGNYLGLVQYKETFTTYGGKSSRMCVYIYMFPCIYAYVATSFFIEKNIFIICINYQFDSHEHICLFDIAAIASGLCHAEYRNWRCIWEAGKIIYALSTWGIVLAG